MYIYIYIYIRKYIYIHPRNFLTWNLVNSKHNKNYNKLKPKDF